MMEISEEQLEAVMLKSTMSGMRMERERMRNILLQLRQLAYARETDQKILGMLEVALQVVSIGDKIQEEMEKNG